MRFLFNDEENFDATVLLILRGIKLASMGSTEKDKMRACFKTILEEFFNYPKYSELLKISREFNDLEDPQIDFILSKDYYEGKAKNEFEYNQLVEEQDEEDKKSEEEEKKMAINMNSSDSKKD